MGTAKKEAARRERKGQTKQEFGNVKVKVRNLQLRMLAQELTGLREKISIAMRRK
jgi:hypothetical protein